MLLEFKTKKNQNGNYKYLAMDTEKKIYSTFNRRMVAGDAIEVKTSDMKKLISKASEYYDNYNEGIN